jgi:hypothetical protein
VAFSDSNVHAKFSKNLSVETKIERRDVPRQIQTHAVMFIISLVVFLSLRKVTGLQINLLRSVG